MKILLALFAISFSFAAPSSALAQTENTAPVEGLYAFETSAGMKVGAAFGALPTVTADDELISVTSPISPRIEIHEMKEVNGIMQMRKVDAIPVLANKENKLVPTGYHLMLMDLSAPLVKGTEFPLTLKFKNTGEKTVTIPVLSRKAK